MASNEAMKAAEAFLVFEESSTEIDERLQIRLAEEFDRFRRAESERLREAIEKIEKLGTQLQNPKHPDFDPLSGQRIMGCAVLVREALAAPATPTVPSEGEKQ